MSKVNKPDGKYRAPDGRIIIVQNGEASYEAPAPAAQAAPQPQLGDDGYKDNYTGLAGSVRSYADAATGGLPTYANAGIGALYDVLKDRFGDNPTGKEFGDAWNQNFEMEQRRAQSAASQHKMDAVAGGLLSPANLVPGLPIAAGASYAHALGGSPWVGAALGTIPTAVQGVKAAAPVVSKFAGPIARELPVVGNIMKAVDKVKGRVPSEAPPTPSPVMPDAPPRRLPDTAPKTTVDPVMPEPGTSPSLRAQGKLPPELDNTVITPLPEKPPPPVPDDGLEELLRKSVEQAKQPPAALPAEPGTQAGIVPKNLEPPRTGVADAAKMSKNEASALPFDEQAAKDQAMRDFVLKERWKEQMKQQSMPPQEPVTLGEPPTSLPPERMAVARKADTMKANYQKAHPELEGATPEQDEVIRAYDRMRKANPVEDPWSPIPENAEPLRPQLPEAKKSWLEETYARLKGLFGPGDNAAKAMENPEVRIRARGGD